MEIYFFNSVIILPFLCILVVVYLVVVLIGNSDYKTIVFGGPTANLTYQNVLFVFFFCYYVR